jgi:serine/threonine-protein kinase
MDGPHAYNELSDRLLGKYRLIASLGEGGMATVFLAIVEGRAGFQKLVVVKVMRETLARDTDALTMFEQEARIASRLNHPNIVQTNEVGEDRGAHFITMEYLEGQPLHQILTANRRGEPLLLSLHLRILADSLAGLHYAHELADFDGKPLNLVHRDVSPHNVFVTYDGAVKIIDFGIAKSALDESKTATGILKGKLAYMAPEQLLGIPLDRRADVYAVGVMLWEAAAGRRLRKAMPEAPLLHSIVNDDVPSPLEVNPACSEALAAICTKALARSRDDRYATAQELQYEIESVLESTEVDRDGTKHLNRSMGAFVSEKFADERSRIRRLVERRLAGAAPAVPTGTAGGDTMVDEPDRAVSGPKASAADASDGAPVSAASATLASAGDPPRVRWMRLAVIAGAFVVLAGGVTVVAVRPEATVDAATAAAVTPATTAPEASPAPPPEATGGDTPPQPTGSVRISISSAPPTARIFVDGKPLAGNPATLDTARDEATQHSIRVEAVGFAAQASTVAFDRNLDLVFTLVKSAGAPATPQRRGAGRAVAPAPVTTAEPPPPAAAPPAPAPPASTSTHRQLDESIPWQK